MPFTLCVRRTVNGEPKTIRWPNLPDEARANSEGAIAWFKSGNHLEGIFFMGDRPIARWCDIRDIWIDEA